MSKVKGTPKWFVGQLVFWRVGLPRPKYHTCSRNEWLFGIAAEGGKAKKALASLKCVFFGRGTPGLKKNTWPKKHFGIPLIKGGKP